MEGIILKIFKDTHLMEQSAHYGMFRRFYKSSYLIRMDESLYFTCGHSIDYTVLKDGINHIYEVLDFVYHIVDEYLSS